MNLEQRKAEREALYKLDEKLRLEARERRRAVEMTTQLIASIVVDANIRAELRPMQKKSVHKK